MADEVGGILDFNEGTLFLEMQDVIYIVDHDIEEKELYEWQDYNVRAKENSFNQINLKSWHMGCPRVSEDTFRRINSLKKEIDDIIQKEKQL